MKRLFGRVLLTRQRESYRSVLPLIAEEVIIPWETQSLLPSSSSRNNNDVESAIIMSSSDLNFSSNTNGDKVDDANNNMPMASVKKSTKRRQKVVAVAKRPLKAVGRFVSKRKQHHQSGYGSVDEGDDPSDEFDDQEVILVDKDGEVSNQLPEMVEPQRPRSFLERVNSYRSDVAGGSTMTPVGVTVGGDSSVGDGFVADQRDWVVFRLERYLRQAIFVLIAFIIGSYHARWRGFISKCLEYVTVAWITCCVLWVMATTSAPQNNTATAAAGEAPRPRRLFASRFAARRAQAAAADASTPETSNKSSDNSIIEKDATADDSSKGGDAPSREGAAAAAAGSDDELAILLPETTVKEADTEAPVKDPDEPVEEEGGEKKKPKKKKSKRLSKKKSDVSRSISSIAEEDASAGGASSSDNAATMPHEALNPFYIIDSATGNRVKPNSKPYPMSNEWFDMEMVAMIRTPDVDDESKPKGTSENDTVCDYMRDKARRFEFQYQLKLKKLPEGQKIYFSAELEEPVKLGIIQRAFVGAAMAFIKSTNSSFHYSMAGSKEDPDGRWEKPHMSFPVELSMDRCVVTKPGETPPKLGEIIHEDPEALKARKKGAPIDWNLEDTYTMALWTSYVDFLEWNVINLPGIRPFELNKVIGPQPIYLTLYLIPNDRAAEKHYRRDITQIVELELCNSDTGLLGAYAKKWSAKSNRQLVTRARSEDTVTELDDDEEEDEDNDEDMEDIDVDEEDNDDDDDEEDGGASSGDALIDETEYDAADAATAAELGEGMYLRSGDSVVLRESGVETDDNAAPCFVTNGAGFAVLSEGVSSASTIVLQKARRKNIKSKARNELIKSGDTVTVRLVTKGRSEDEREVKYLSIHRGWWLKWVTSPPKKNGYFTIITHETEFTDQDPDELRASETQSSYLTFGGSFWLRHRRWSHYSVGASAQGSATYGGRVLGLFQPHRPGASQSNEMSYNSDDEEFSIGNGKIGKRRVMKTLQLRAYEIGQASVTPITKVGSEEQPAEETTDAEKPKLVFSNEDSHLDVPAWVEVMNRTERIRQLAYAVRVVPCGNDEPQPSGEATPCEPFVRLRTGRDLAEVMRVGLSWRSTAAFPPRKRGPTTPVSPQKTTSGSSNDGYATPTRGASSPSAAALSMSVSSRGKEGQSLPNMSSMDGSFDDLGPNENGSAWDEGSDDADGEETEGQSTIIEYSEISGAPVKKTKRRIVGSTIGAIGKVGAKVAKAGAKAGVKAGGAVAKGSVAVTKASAAGSKKVVVSSVKASVKVGKGTVTAGKAIIGGTGRNKAPPAREPKSKATQSVTRWRKDKDLHVGVKKRGNKHIKADHANLFFLAGELAAPEQSYRTVSNVLTRMSCVPTESPFSTKFNNILATQIVQSSDQDSWFLSGGAMQVGVVPDARYEVVKGPLECESLVARCLWESHWREEWCGVYKKGIVFYAPLTQKPCMELSFSDVQSVRLLDSRQRSPLPGFPILALETAWQCHYVAFRNEEGREVFKKKVEDLIPKRSTEIQITGASERELWKARFWQGFQNSVESDSSVGRGKWAEVQSGSKSISRTILNSRRMDFDLDPEFLRDQDGLGKFVEDLLSTSLSFSLSSLERDPERLVKFLDAVSHLRLIPMIEIDRDSVDAFCLFVNLYHCLLQHALLLAVNGPLHRRTVANFMRASCYEIGGDVFSLAEIQSCIIRGNMSRPVSPKPPYVDVSKKSNAYRFYALKYTDARVNFVLNTGDVACPQDVPVLRPDKLEEQLAHAAVVFLESQLSVDVIRRCVLLPKVCEVFKNDFDDEGSGCLYYCSRYLDSATVNSLKRMLREETTLTIKYQSNADQYHTKLILRTDKEETIPE